MEKMMKTIKKYWAIIVGAILALFGIAVAVKKKTDDKKIADTDKKIADNKQQVDVISGKVDAIEDQKHDVKTDINDLKQDVQELVEQKQDIVVEKPKTAKQTKTNILNKTNKRKKK
jgi:chromosome segregation ATPase